MGETFGLRGDELWRARKRLGVSRGAAARALGLHDKTYGAIERRGGSIPPESLEQALLFVRLANGINGDHWEPKERKPKTELPFSRPDCPDCKIPLTTKSVNLSPVRGRTFYFQCKQCGGRFWSNDGEIRRANEGRGNWKNLKGRPKCSDCAETCWVDERAGQRRRKRIWICPKCKKRYTRSKGNLMAVELEPKRRRVSFLRNRDCPKCSGLRLRLRASPPNAPYWYFNCPDCHERFRWNPELGRLVVARGKSKKRHAGRKPGMTKERIAEAERIEDLVRDNGGQRGALKQAVEQFRKESGSKLDFHTDYERVQKIRQDYRAYRTAQKHGRK